ncbi:unnamed protein product [Gongylonema pulchrum]|uniref:PKD_channel domain-containing protein n=1 Tax=Gongylonema pulchrum TaxID=637853 RepID=A0A183DWJ8_9BILA|nr:unnamed protein product [Gongylonema pulchrum]
MEFVETVLKRKLSLSDRLEFLNLWYLMIVTNDIFIILGTLCKITIEFRDFDNDLFTTSGVLLGTGALLVYGGVLRYFGFFSKYNIFNFFFSFIVFFGVFCPIHFFLFQILILTLKKSLPNILRFMSCTAVLYAGFLIAGWILILTLKKSLPNILRFMSCTAVLYAGFLIAGWFRTLGQSSEALFSLLNGDDMFATFFTINETNTIVRIFGTIYIYLFVSLFIYVVLSLFIAIIMDAYEVIRDRYRSQEIEEPSLLQFLAAGQHPDPTNDAEARFQYSSKNLLRLGK